MSTALGLQPGLAVFERDVLRESAALTHLACWAGRFTPTVSLSPPAGLLLEIGGCLRLFGGVAVIVEAVLNGCAEQGYSTRWAVAPSPLGARWLAQAGAGEIHAELPAMQSALAVLPCRIPGWPDEVEDRLNAFGLKRLGDLRVLPGASLRRRIGNGPLDDLARAWGDFPTRKSRLFSRIVLPVTSSCRLASSMPRRWLLSGSACLQLWPAGYTVGNCWFVPARC